MEAPQLPTLILSKVSDKKVGVIIKNKTGEVIEDFQLRFSNFDDQKQLAYLTKLPRETVINAMFHVRNNGSEATTIPLRGFDVTVTDTTPVEFLIRMRGIEQSKDYAQFFSNVNPVDALRESLNFTEFIYSEPVIEWDDTTQLAVLDGDYHYDDSEQRRKPDPAWLRIKLANLKPSPVCYHISHGIGIKAYYAARDGYTAAELAAIAGLHWLSQDIR